MTLTNPADRSAVLAADGPANVEIRDERTGQTVELPIENDAIRARDLAQIRRPEDESGLVSYDPAFLNTASCRSAITYIDGDRGILLYRGYPIEELAAKRSYLDVAWLLIHGELPTATESAAFAESVRAGAELPAGVVALIELFPQDAHPMAILMAGVRGARRLSPREQERRRCGGPRS